MEAQLPHYRKFSRTLETLTCDAITRMLKDPVIRGVRDSMIRRLHHIVLHTPEQHWGVFAKATSITEVLTVLSFVSSHLENLCNEYVKGMRFLIVLIQIQVPDLFLILGPYLKDYLSFGFYPAIGLEPPATWVGKAYRLRPDNPLMIDGDGRLVGWEDVTSMKDFMDVKEYQKSLEPAIPRGRPLGSKRPQNIADSSRRRPPINPVDAVDAYQMKLDGTHWTVIAQKFFPLLDLEDKHQRNNARGRVKNLTERGSLIVNHKTPQ